MATVKQIDSRGKVRTSNYRFTIESKDDKNLTALKESIRKNNRYRKTVGLRPERVRLMPRGPRRETARKDAVKPYLIQQYKAYDSYLPQRHATHFDVYVHEVR